MKDKLNVQNAIMSVLIALICFMGSWVFDINTKTALLEQRITAEEIARKEDYVFAAKERQKNERSTGKMAETMASLDKTLSLLADRLDRGDITIRSSAYPRP